MWSCKQGQVVGLLVYDSTQTQSLLYMYTIEQQAVGAPAGPLTCNQHALSAHLMIQPLAGTGSSECKYILVMPP